ncbi:MAG: hypothetical protein FWG96_06870 [Methanomassiliicoccaceae archaeon]|nr:hypothetical protein [Methanomassiliicoccaceae archaeon]
MKNKRSILIGLALLTVSLALVSVAIVSMVGEKNDSEIYGKNFGELDADDYQLVTAVSEGSLISAAVEGGQVTPVSETVTLTLNAYPAGTSTFQYRIQGTTTWQNYFGLPVTLYAGDIIEITTAAAIGFDFRFWEDASTSAVRTYTISSDATLIAYFLTDTLSDRSLITLNSIPAGAGMFTWSLPGMTASVVYDDPFYVKKSDDLTISTSAEADYTFRYWNDNSTNLSKHVGAHPADTIYTAYFLGDDAVALTLNTYPAITGTFEYRLQGTAAWITYLGMPVLFNIGDEVEIKAAALPGYTFRFWEDAGVVATRMYTILPESTPSDNVLTAYFLGPDTALITLTVSPVGAGTFTWSLPGMTVSIPYVGPFQVNTIDYLAISVAEEPGEIFQFWEDNSTDLSRIVGTNSYDTEYTAYFLIIEKATLTLNAYPAITGTFEYRLQGSTAWDIYYGTPIEFTVGDIVEIRATALPQYTFRFWEDSSYDYMREFTIPSGGAVLTAYFLGSDTAQITLTASPAGAGTFAWFLPGMAAPVQYVEPFHVNTTDYLTIYAAEEPGCTFLFWEDYSTDASRIVGTNSYDTEYTAYFLTAVTATLTLNTYPVMAGIFEYRLQGMTLWASYPGTPMTLNVDDVVEIRVTALSGYTFRFWEDGDDADQRMFTMPSSDTVLTAYFFTGTPGSGAQITLTASPAGAGTFAWSLPGMAAPVEYIGPFRVNTTDYLTIYVTEEPGETFQHWEDNSTGPSRVVGTNSYDTEYIAYFLTAEAATLTLNTYPAIADTFEYRLLGMVSWIAYSGTPMTLNAGDVVEVRIVATNGYTFRFWEDASINPSRTHTMSAVPGDNVLTAYFLSEDPNDQAYITLAASPPGAGIFSWQLDGMTAFIPYVSGTPFVINKSDDLFVETEDELGYTFRFWEDNSTNPVRHVGTHTADTAVYTAYFLDDLNAVTLTLEASPGVTPEAGTFEYRLLGTTTWLAYSIPVQFNVGDNIEVGAVAAPGYTFMFWEDAIYTYQRTFTIPAGGVSHTAYFLSANVSDQVEITLTASPPGAGTFSWQLDGMTAFIPYVSGTPFAINKSDDLIVEALGEPGYTFLIWENNSTNLVRYVGTHTADTAEYTAYFLGSNTATLTLEVSPDVTPEAGIFEYRLLGTTTWLPYTTPVQFNVGDNIEVRAAAASPYTFMFWEDAIDTNPRIFTIPVGGVSHTAYFLGTDTVEITLVAVPSVGGMFSWQLDGMTASVPYVSGTPFFINKSDDLTVEAAGEPGYTLLIWEDATTTPTRHVGDHLLNTTGTETYTAFFTPNNPAERFALDLQAVPSWLGTFEYMLPGMTAWAAYTGSEMFNVGDTVQVRAVGVQGYAFQYWEVITNTNPVRSFDSINNSGFAYFLADDSGGRVRITLTNLPSGAGTFTWQLYGMPYALEYTGPFYVNRYIDDLTIVAIAEPDYTFKQWIDEPITTALRDIYSFYLDDDEKEYIAYFLTDDLSERADLTLYDLPVGYGDFKYQIAGVGMTSWHNFVGTTMAFNKGDIVYVRADAQPSCTFMFWEDMDTNPLRQFDMSLGDQSDTAYFVSDVFGDWVEITLTASPSGAGTFTWWLDGMTASVPYVDGVPFRINKSDRLFVEATAEPGYAFKVWSNGTANPTLDVADHSGNGNAHTYTAYFLGNDTAPLFVIPTPTGAGTFEYRYLGMEGWTAYTYGESFNVGDIVELRAVPIGDYEFQFWEDASEDKIFTTSIDQLGTTVYAYFLSDDPSDWVEITLTASPSGAGTFSWSLPGMTASFSYVSGTPFMINKADYLTIETTEDMGTFMYWEDFSTSPYRNVGDHLSNITGTAEYTAYFSGVDMVVLILESSPAAADVVFEYRVNGTPSWTTYTMPVQLNPSDVVEINTYATNGYTFRFWENNTNSNPRTYTMSSVPYTNETLTAYFLSDNPGDWVTITLTASPPGAGTFSWQLDGMTAFIPYVSGTPFVINKSDNLFIEAEAELTHTFMFWDDTSTILYRNVGDHLSNIVGTEEYTAYFLGTDTAPLFIGSMPAGASTFEYRYPGMEGWTTYTYGELFNIGDVVELRAVPESGYDFLFWQDASEDEIFITLIDQIGTTVYAYFLSDDPSDWVEITLTASPLGAGTFRWQFFGMTAWVQYVSGTPFVVNKADYLMIEIIEDTGTFLYWEDMSTSMIRLVGTHVTDTKSYTAYFSGVDMVVLTLESSPAAADVVFEYRVQGTPSWITYTMPVQFNPGETVEIRTSATNGYTFRFWEDNTTSNPRTYTMSLVPYTNETLTAYFLSDNSGDWVEITLTASPPGAGTFSWQLDGMTAFIPYVSGTPFVINKSDDLTVHAEQAALYTFVSWENVYTTPTWIVGDHLLNTTGTEGYTAYFLDAAAPYLTLEALPDVNPAAGTFEYRLMGMTAWLAYAAPVQFNVGDAIEVRATAESGYSFLFWENADDNAERAYTMPVGDTTLTAYFLGADTVEITLIAVPSVGGTFSWQLDGMTDFVPYISGTPFEINKIDDLTIRAEAELTHTFLVWEDASTSPTRNVGNHPLNAGTETYTAFFTSDNPAERFALDLQAVPSWLGTFEYMLSGMTGWAAYTGSEMFNVGDTVQVRAVGVQGYTFQYWEVITNTNPVRSFDSINNTGVAYFLADDPNSRVLVTMTDVPSGTGTFTWQVYGMPNVFEYTGPFYVNKHIDDLVIGAIAELGYTFQFWMDEHDDNVSRTIDSWQLGEDEKNFIAYFLTDNLSEQADLTLYDLPAGYGDFKYQIANVGMTYWREFVGGTTMAFNDVDVVNVRADAQPVCTFLFWEDADTDPERTFNMSAGDQSDTAYFLGTDTVEITLIASPSGAGTFEWQLGGMTAFVPYVDGVPFVINKTDYLMIETIEDTGTFMYWEDSSTSMSRAVGTHVTDTKSYTAYFSGVDMVTLTLESSPAAADVVFEYRVNGVSSWTTYTMPVQLNPGDIVEIRTYATNGYTFRFWEDNTNSNPRTYTMSSVPYTNETLTAYFLSDNPGDWVTITLTADPSAGGTFTLRLGGMTGSFPCASGASFAINKDDDLTIAVDEAQDYTFQYWLDNVSASQSRNVGTHIVATAEYTAYFLDDLNAVSLTLNADPATAGTFDYRLQGMTDWVAYLGSPEWFNIGDVIEIIATAAPDYTFQSWEDAGTNPVRTVTMSAGGAALTASFLSDDPPTTVYLTLESYSVGAGTFEYRLQGEAVWNTYTTSAAFYAGDVVVIRAIAEPGYTFQNWEDLSTGEYRVYTISSDAMLTAYFQSSTVTLTLTAYPLGMASFQYRLQGDTAWTPHTGVGLPITFNVGDIVEVNPVPSQPTVDFWFWEDTSTDTPKELTLSADTSLNAYFLFNIAGGKSTITLTASPPGTGTFYWQLDGMTVSIPYEGPFEVNKMDSLTIEAVGGAGYGFQYWEDNSTDPSRHLSMVTDDTGYTAYFDVTAPLILDTYPAGAGTFEYRLKGATVWIPYGGMPATFDIGDTVEIRAIAEPTYAFRFWENADDDPVMEYTILPTGNTLMAYFLSEISNERVQITLDAFPGGAGTFEWTLPGMSVFLGYNGSFYVNNTDDLTIITTEAYGYTFLYWEDNSVSTSRFVSAPQSGDASYRAYFLGPDTVTLTLESYPEGAGAFEYKLTGTETWFAYEGLVVFNENDSIEIRTTVEPEYVFRYWEDSSTGTDRVYTMSADAALTAYFQPSTVTLTLSAYPLGSGALQYRLLGDTAWTPYLGLPVTFNLDEIVEISPVLGSDFRFWEDASTDAIKELTLSDDASLTAYFLYNTAGSKSVITLTADPPGAGTFAWSLPGMTASIPYGGQFEVNKMDLLTIEVSENAGYVFLYWDDNSTNPSRYLGMNLVDMEYTAYFLESDTGRGAPAYTWTYASVSMTPFAEAENDYVQLVIDRGTATMNVQMSEELYNEIVGNALEALGRDLDRQQWGYTDTLGDYLSYEDPVLKSIADAFTVVTAGWSDSSRINFVLRFVQNIPFVTDNQSMGVGEYWKLPTETFWEGKALSASEEEAKQKGEPLLNRGGDCEDHALLFVYLIKAMDYEFVIHDVDTKGIGGGRMGDHITAGVLVTDGTGTHVEYGGKTYYYCDATWEGYKLGMLGGCMILNTWEENLGWEWAWVGNDAVWNNDPVVVYA